MVCKTVTLMLSAFKKGGKGSLKDKAQKISCLSIDSGLFHNILQRFLHNFYVSNIQRCALRACLSNSKEHLRIYEENNLDRIRCNYIHCRGIQLYLLILFDTLQDINISVFRFVRIRYLLAGSGRKPQRTTLISRHQPQ